MEGINDTLMIRWLEYKITYFHINRKQRKTSKHLFRKRYKVTSRFE